MSSSQASSPEEGEIDLASIFHELAENKWLIICVTFITLSIGIIFASRQPPQYQADVLLQVASNPQGIAGALGGKLNPAGMGGGDTAAVQEVLIKSRFILEPVVEQLSLNISAIPKQSWLMRHIYPQHTNIQMKLFEVPSYLLKHPFELIVDKNNYYRLYNESGGLLLEGQSGHIAATQDNLIRLKVDTRNVKAGDKYILKRYPDSEIIQTLNNQLRITNLGGQGYGMTTDVLNIALKGGNPQTIVNILNAIAHITQEKDAQKKSLEAAKTLEFLKEQIPLTKKSLEESEVALNQYRAKSGKIDIKVQTRFLLTQLIYMDKKIALLRNKKIDLSQDYTELHPYLITLDKKIKSMTEERKKLEKHIRTLPASDQITINLMRDVKVKSTLYMILLSKTQELEIIKGGSISSVRILSLARFPHSPVPFKKAAIYGGSIFIGLMLSFLWIFGRKLIAPRVSDPHWSERHFDLINLAIIPYSKEQAPKGQGKNTTIKQLPLLAHVNPRNLAIESLRSLRTTLQVRLSCASNNIVTILGVSPGVGKTFVSANLAYLLATSGKRVVLIDTDLRKGTLHKYYNLPPSPGLAEVLNSKTELIDTVMPSGQENLMILPRGTYPNDPSELLMSEQFKNVLSTLSEQFDIVVIDTPPVLLVTDAVLIGVLAGTNYLVVGAKAHQPVEIEMAIRRLKNAGVHLHGSIYNFHKNETKGQQRYGRYSNYYQDDEVVKK